VEFRCRQLWFTPHALAIAGKGGKNRRRGKKDSDLGEKRELEVAEEGQCTYCAGCLPRACSPGTSQRSARWHF